MMSKNAMADDELKTSWMWQNENGGVNGASVDDEAGYIYWYDDAAGCACGVDTGDVQSFAQFRQDGPPLMHVPEDVLAELNETLNRLTAIA